MIRYIKKYPVSLAFILLVVYLSFFKPPSLSNSEWEIPHFDKIAHMGMYFGMSGLLWWEFLRGHKNGVKYRRAWIGAFLFPVLFGGCVELLQEFCTSYRAGEWLDFIANTAGATLASFIAYYVLRKRMPVSNHPNITGRNK